MEDRRLGNKALYVASWAVTAAAAASHRLTAAKGLPLQGDNLQFDLSSLLLRA